MHFWIGDAKSMMLNPAIGACKQIEKPIFITTTTVQPTVKVEEVRVDMAGMKVASTPVELVTSVGSCVAICLHDSTNKCGGLAHIMLPDSSIFPREILPSKFADTAVPALAKAIRRINSKETPLFAKISGGANMFPDIKNSSVPVGDKNVEAVKQALATHKIPLLNEDVGGSWGRRISFNVITGVATIRRVQGEVKTL